jgi:pimeloyl-ACP methyl ester carboxylesterase
MVDEPQSRPQLTDEGILDLPGLASRWVRLADGRRAHYVTSGNKGPAVVLLHGGIEGSSGTAGWRFMAPFLGANGFRVYCPDRPGYGLSDTSQRAYLDTGPKAQVDFLKMFVDALCLDKFHLSGNSAGCVLSAWFLVNHPERVTSVAFIAGGVGDVAGAQRISPAQSKFTPKPDFQRLSFDGSHQSMRDMMDAIIYKQSAVWPEMVEMRVRAANAQRAARKPYGMPPAGRASALTDDPNILQFMSTKGRITELTIPMIYFYGLLDVLLPVENGFNQEDRVPNIQFFYPDEAGHQGQTDRPAVFNQAFLEFFRDGKVSWPTAQEAGVSQRRPINPKLVEEAPGGFPQPNPGMYADIATLRQGLNALT